MCGGVLFSGVEVSGLGDVFLDESIGYAINEGGVLHDRIDREHYPEGEEEPRIEPIWWRVAHANSFDLERIRRLSAKLIPGTVITVAGGAQLTVAQDGVIRGAMGHFAGLDDLPAPFDLDVPDSIPFDPAAVTKPSRGKSPGMGM